MKKVFPPSTNIPPFDHYVGLQFHQSIKIITSELYPINFLYGKTSIFFKIKTNIVTKNNGTVFNIKA